MAGTFESSCILEEEIKEMFLNMRLLPSLQYIAKIRHQTRVFEGIRGVVRLTAAPHFCLTLDTGSPEHPYVVPLTLVDTATHLPHWLLAIGRLVYIHKLLVVCEHFQMLKKSEELHYVNAMVNWKDVRILDNNSAANSLTSLPENNSSSDVFHSKNLSNNGIQKKNVCRVMVHHVSTSFYVDVAETVAHCLVFLSYINCKHLEVKLWIVLKAEQVSWKEFLVPNREYVIEFFPEGTEKYFFDKHQKPLDDIFTPSNKELGVIFHHKTLFSTLNGCELPFGSKVFLSCNTEFSKFVYQFTKDLYTHWYSASEAENADVDLVTLYGKVDCVLYDEEVVYKTCYLCNRAKSREPILTEPKLTVNHPWTNPWMSKLSRFKADDLFELPSAEENKLTMRTGVPGKMVQIIKLVDVTTGSEHSVYIKHSCLPQSQQLFRISSGMVLCITHLNRRCSNAGKYYFITTVLSNFRVLSYESQKNCCEGWGLYGLRHNPHNVRDKMWGVLETLNISKVAITARCAYCKAEFSRGSCSLACAVPDKFTTSAYAIAKLQIIHNECRISMEKVLIKDNLVQTLLNIPTNIWQKCLRAAAEGEIVCFPNSRSPTEHLKQLDFNALFKMYCEIPKPKGKFYISVRKMPSLSSDDAFYYCIQLEPINEYRLNIVADLARKSLNIKK